MFSTRAIGRLAQFFKWVVLAGLVTGCASSPSSLAPGTPNAAAITHLTWLIFGIAAFVFVIVEGTLIFTVLKFRHKGGSNLQKDDLPRQIEGNRRLEIAWTLAPAIVLAIVFVISLKVLGIVAYQPDPASDPNALNIRVVGHQWWWEVDYPDLHIVTAGEIHVPVNVVVNVTVESADVIHSYWVPQLGGKIDVIPGHTNHTWFKVNQAGIYLGQCAEYCGMEHANMRMEVIAEASDQFQVWVTQQQAPVAAMTGNAATGEQTFLNGACVACHTIQGTTAKGHVGPDLTHYASRQEFAGGILENNPENLAAWLSDPQKIKPGAQMPDLGLSADQIAALVAFLEALK